MSGRFGVYLILFVVVGECFLQLTWKPAFPHYKMWEPFNPYLLILLLGGLVLLVRSIIVEIQERWASVLPKVSFAPINWQGQGVVGIGSVGSSPTHNLLRGGVTLQPLFLLSPLGSQRRIQKRAGLGLIVLALILCAQSLQLILLSAIMIGAGAALVLWSENSEIDELRSQGEIRGTFRPMACSRRRPVRISVIHPLNYLLAWPLVLAMIFWILWMPFAIDSRSTPMGLKVYVLNPGKLPVWNGPWKEPLVLRVSNANLWYLNREPISRGDLEGRLRVILSLRADQTVFLDAAESNPYAWTVVAASEIQKVPSAKVVLVTPQMKSELPRLDGRYTCEPVAVDTKMPERLGWRNRPYPVDYWRGALFRYTINAQGVVTKVEIVERGALPDEDVKVAHSIKAWRFASRPGCGEIQVDVRM